MKFEKKESQYDMGHSVSYRKRKRYRRRKSKPLVHRLLKYVSDKKKMTDCDVSKFTGTMQAVDVLKEQMDDMLENSTVKAYKLASRANREQTANGYDSDRFENMVRSSTYSPLLNAKDYAYIQTSKDDCDEKCSCKFDVLLYDEDRTKPTHGYEFLLSRQTDEDLHESLKPYELHSNSQYWRTDHVLPISSNELQKKHTNMIDQRQKSLRKACFGESYNHRSVQHSFGSDKTHNLCCQLGEKASEYADNSGNPIGTAAKKLHSKNKWSTCMGSNVCSYYAEEFNKKETEGNKTEPLFATSPDLYKLSTYIPSNVNCEAYAAEQLSMSSHGTPGIRTRGKSELCTEKKLIDDNIFTSHKKIQSIIDDMLQNA